MPARARPVHRGLTVAVLVNSIWGVLGLLPALMGLSIYVPLGRHQMVFGSALVVLWIVSGYALLVAYWVERWVTLGRSVGIGVWLSSTIYNGLLAGTTLVIGIGAITDRTGWIVLLGIVGWAGFMVWLSLAYFRSHLRAVPSASDVP